MKTQALLVNILALSLVGASLPVLGQTVPRAEQEAWALGTGYDTKTKEPRAQCLKGRVHYRGLSEGQLHLTTNLSLNGIRSSLSGKVSAEINAVVLGGSASAYTSTSYEDGAMAGSTGFKYEMRGKTAALIDYELTEVGKNALALNDPKAFEEICGNSFLDSADMGGVLLVHNRLDLSKKYFRNQIDIKTQVCVLGICKSDSVTVVNQKLQENTLITTTATQLGGNKSRLPKFEIKSCRVDNVEPCRDIVNQILDYVNGPEGFAAQMASLEYNEAKLEDSPILQYGLDSYARTGLLPSYWSFSEEGGTDPEFIEQFVEVQSEVLKRQARAEILLANAELEVNHQRSVQQYLNFAKNASRKIAASMNRCQKTGSCILEIRDAKNLYQQLMGQDMVLELQDSEMFKSAR